MLRDIRGKLREVWKGAVLSHVELLRQRSALKGVSPTEYLIENNTDAVDVSSLVVTGSSKYLWCHIVHGANAALEFFKRALLTGEYSDSKVTKANTVFVNNVDVIPEGLGLVWKVES